MTGRAKGILAITASAFGFALMAAFVRLADDVGPPLSCFQKSLFRNLVALVVALGVLSRSRSGGGLPVVASCRGLLRNRRAFWTLLLRSALGTCGIFANFYALGRIPIAEGQTLNKTAPFFTVACAWMFLGERAGARQIAALVVAFAGVLFVAKPGFAGEASFPLAIGLVGGICAGSAYACVRSLRRHAVDPAFIVAFFSAFSCIVAIPFAAAAYTPMTFAQLLVLLGAGVGASAGQFGVTLAYGYAAPREIAVWDYSNIIFTALLGFAMFGQVPDAWSVLGFLLVVVAARFLSRAEGFSDIIRNVVKNASERRRI